MSYNWAQVNASGIGDVAAAPDGRVWVSGTNGTVWYSDDQGQKFSEITASGVIRVAIGPDSVLWGVGVNGTLWSHVPFHIGLRPVPQWTQSVAVSAAADVTAAPDGSVWLTTRDGSIMVSHDNGASFSKIDASGFACLSADTDSSIWAVGTNGSLWHYDSSGSWFQTPASGMQDVGVEHLTYFGGDHAGRIWLVGKNGSVWLSIDKGQTFSQKVDAQGFASVCGAGEVSKAAESSAAGEDAWFVGANGSLWRRLLPADYISIPGTEHFTVMYDTALSQSGKKVAEQLTWITEGVYRKLSSLFGGIGASRLPIQLAVDALSGGARSAIGTIDIHAMSDVNSARYLLVAELAEVFMRSQSGGAWNPNNSKGEGLSCVMGDEAFSGIAEGRVNTWLNGARSTKWITANDDTDTNEESYGCAILYLNYLHYQLKCSWEDIIASKSETLDKLYATLTGKTDAVSSFMDLINSHFPTGTPYEGSPDNVFPLD